MPDALMPELGHVRVTVAGQDHDFVPSLAAINSLGSGAEIIQTAADLHDRRPLFFLAAARAVMLACYRGDPEALLPLIGWQEDGRDHPGAMPQAELLAVARHLIQHGTAGKAKPGSSRGQYTAEFSVAQHVAAAVGHLGVSRADALAMTMTEMQFLIEAKFPEARAKEVPSREEYRKQLAAIMAKRKGKRVH